jgi:hypothetical protein
VASIHRRILFIPNSQNTFQSFFIPLKRILNVSKKTHQVYMWRQLNGYFLFEYKWKYFKDIFKSNEITFIFQFSWFLIINYMRLYYYRDIFILFKFLLHTTIIIPKNKTKVLPFERFIDQSFSIRWDKIKFTFKLSSKDKI